MDKEVFTPRTEEQLKALEELMKIECAYGYRYCTEKWCAARRKIREAFGIY